MLLRGVLEPVNPQERAVYRNLRVLVEAAAVQQAESSTSRLRPAPSLPTGGRGRANRIAPCARRHSHQAQLGVRQPRRGPTGRLLHTDRRHVSGPTHTKTLIASSATSIGPDAATTTATRWRAT